MLTQITCQVSELDRSEHKSVQRGRLQAAGRGVSVHPFLCFFSFGLLSLIFNFRGVSVNPVYVCQPFFMSVNPFV